MVQDVRVGAGGFGRLLLAILIAGAVVAGTIGPTPGRAAAQDAAPANNVDQFANVELPGDLGQSSFQVWVKRTKHTIRGYMLDYWRANGAASVYGNPISEPFASADNRYSQAFENGIFEFYAELIWTDAPSISLEAVGTTVLQSRLGDVRRDGRRDGGGGNRQMRSFRPVAPASESAQRALRQGGIYSEATGHTVSGAFLDWYNEHEGYAYLGNPLSQPVTERGMVVQYFDGALLMRDDDGEISLAPIVAEHAAELGVDTTPVDRGDLPAYNERLFWKTDNPNRLGDGNAPGRKWIDISISQQTLRAYQGDTLITQTLISTGLSPNDTEKGVFHVRYKLEKQDMEGTTGPNGEVVAVGEELEEPGAPRGPRYIVEDVPHVMYVNMDAEALHGAYWHNNFGYRMSHGCINLPLDMATFLFGWAPLGTMVWIHD